LPGPIGELVQKGTALASFDFLIAGQQTNPTYWVRPARGRRFRNWGRFCCGISRSEVLTPADALASDVQEAPRDPSASALSQITRSTATVPSNLNEVLDVPPAAARLAEEAIPLGIAVGTMPLALAVPWFAETHQLAVTLVVLTGALPATVMLVVWDGVPVRATRLSANLTIMLPGRGLPTGRARRGVRATRVLGRAK
jgi:hypothetical protein